MDKVLDVKKVWDLLKAIQVDMIVLKRLVAWFKDPGRLQRLKQNKKVIATSIKERLDNGEYGVVNCLFNTATGDIEGEAEGMRASRSMKKPERNLAITK